MSERLAVLARHLASEPDRQGEQRIASATPTSSSLPLSPSSRQLGAFCPRELSKFMTHDNHELRGRIQEFLKVSFEVVRRCREGGEAKQRKNQWRRARGGSSRRWAVVHHRPLDGRGAAASPRVLFFLSLPAGPCTTSRRHRRHAERKERRRKEHERENKKGHGNRTEAFLCDAAG